MRLARLGACFPSAQSGKLNHSPIYSWVYPLALTYQEACLDCLGRCITQEHLNRESSHMQKQTNGPVLPRNLVHSSAWFDLQAKNVPVLGPVLWPYPGKEANPRPQPLLNIAFSSICPPKLTRAPRKWHSPSYSPAYSGMWTQSPPSGSACLHRKPSDTRCQETRSTFLIDMGPKLIGHTSLGAKSTASLKQRS